MHVPNMPSATKEEDDKDGGIPTNIVVVEEKHTPVPALLIPLGGGSKMIRAPFALTLRFDAPGVNVAFFSVPGRGHIYWGTALSPRPGLDVDSADATLAPPEVRNAMCDLCGSDAIKAQLWLMKGDVLPLNPRGLERVPTDTRARLRVGFMDWKPMTRSSTNCFKLQRRVARLHRVLSERGGAQLGVRRISGGNGSGFRFSLRRVTGMLTCSAPELAALLADYGLIADRFTGRVSYAARCGRKGLICMVEGVPNGDWFSDRFRDTGFGLLCRSEDSYFRVIQRGNNTCRLLRVRAGDIEWDKWNVRTVHVANVIE